MFLQLNFIIKILGNLLECILLSIIVDTLIETMHKILYLFILSLELISGNKNN